MQTVFVLGGAGFVGSAIAKRFASAGCKVTVVDGFLERTGACKQHLDGACIALIPQSIEQLDDSVIAAMAQADVIVDAMAWTSHIAALQDPEYDMRLNLCAHMHLLSRLPADCAAHIIFLGSRGQYGRTCDTPIVEGSRMFPDDVQGIHKTASDHYFRIMARIKRLHVTCLRFPNCYGPGQRTAGEDIGLIGSFISDALRGKNIEIFGATRCRSIVFVQDVAECVRLLGERVPEGYCDFNMAGLRINLVELVERIVAIAGSGSYSVAPMPDTIRAIDMGDAPVNEERLRQWIGAVPQTDLDRALTQTIDSFRRSLHDLAL